VAKNKKRTLPGSIYKPANCNRLYIEFKGKKIATGLLADKQGYMLANKFLEKLYFKYYNLDEFNYSRTFESAWQEYKQTLIHKQEKTIYNYESSYKNIVIDTSLLVNTDNIESLVIHYLKTTNNNKVSINTNLTQFQVFLNYCSSKKYCDKTNIKAKYSFKIQKGQAQSYSKNEYCNLLKYFYHYNKEFYYLIAFMIETGSRVIDCLTLTWQDIDFNNEYIIFRNKITKHNEKRPASKLVFKILRRLKSKDKIFSWQYSSAPTLSKKLNKAMDILSIDKDKRGLQEFRVTFRMRMHERGMPEDYIEYLLRHSTTKLMQNYYTDYKIIEDKIREFLNKKV